MTDRGSYSGHRGSPRCGNRLCHTGMMPSWLLIAASPSSGAGAWWTQCVLLSVYGLAGSVTTLSYSLACCFTFYFLIFKSSPTDMLTDFRQRKGRERERERERETSPRKREIDRLSPICTPTGGGTCNLLVRGTMLQPPEPPGHGPPV